MKRLVRFFCVAILGLIFSLFIPTLIAVTSQPTAQIQSSPLGLVQTGKQYYDAGQFLAAIEILKEAARIYQSQGDLLQQAQILSLLSLAQQKLSNFDEATDAINTSLSILDTLEASGKVNRVRAQILNAQAHLQLAKGNPEAALNDWRNGEKFYHKANNIQGVIGSQINQAQALQSLGLYRQAYQLLNQIEQKLATLPNSPLKVIGLQSLGNILRQRGELEHSQKLLQASLDVAQQLGYTQKLNWQKSSFKQSKILLSLANTKFTLFRKSKAIKDEQTASKYFQQAISYYQEAGKKANSPLTKVQAQLNQLSLLIENQKLSSIPSLVPSIQQKLTDIPASRESVYARVNLSENLMKLQNQERVFAKENTAIANPQTVARILTTAIQQAQELDDKRAEAYALGSLGKLYEQTGNWSQAQNLTQSALLIAQGINAPEIAYQLQWQMGRILQMQAVIKPGEETTSTQAINYYTQAFHNLNTLRSDLAVLSPEIQFSFREKVEPVYRQLVELLLRDRTPSKDNLIQARDVIEALQLAELDNFFQDACAKPIAVNIDNLDANAAVIYPIILGNSLEVVVKLPGTDNLLHFSHKDVNRNQVDDVVEQMRKLLRKRSTSTGKIKKISIKLYNWLIQPVESELEKKIERGNSQIKTLVFVLDGSLQNIPMSLLYDGEKYLVERYAVAVTPGLQLLAPTPLVKKEINALIAGANNSPSFQSENLAPLENVKVELLEVSKEVSKNSKLENQNFRKQNIQQKINSNSFNVVHIATHGKFSSNPEQTFILDWDQRIKVKDWDSLLQIQDFRRETPVELLVLSACETATGDKRAALGLAGVAIRAGARSTLATLWQVNDASTAEFMIQFYKQLNNPNITKAEAVRNAQLTFLKDYPDTDYNRPYHWAPFILVGNWL